MLRIKHGGTKGNSLSPVGWFGQSVCRVKALRLVEVQKDFAKSQNPIPDWLLHLPVIFFIALWDCERDSSVDAFTKGCGGAWREKKLRNYWKEMKSIFPCRWERISASPFNFVMLSPDLLPSKTLILLLVGHLGSRQQGSMESSTVLSRPHRIFKVSGQAQRSFPASLLEILK